ncbi:MAG: hypothetical protein APF84_08215 [Gracilibacter sp. BRH_c7a]|nr:MAG: hypothetical protein APF84_08215 [Gracilibacter sp. BRH_c7a]
MICQKLDCRYDACPIPLLKASQALEKLSAGDILEINTGYMCAAENIIQWAEKHEVGYWMEEDEETGELTVFLKKRE